MREQQRIEGLSARAHAATRYAEDRGFWPNATAAALASYRRTLPPTPRHELEGLLKPLRGRSGETPAPLLAGW